MSKKNVVWVLMFVLCCGLTTAAIAQVAPTGVDQKPTVDLVNSAIPEPPPAPAKPAVPAAPQAGTSPRSSSDHWELEFHVGGNFGSAFGSQNVNCNSADAFS